MFKYLKNLFSQPDANWKANQDFLEHIKNAKHEVTPYALDFNADPWHVMCYKCGTIIPNTDVNKTSCPKKPSV